MREEFAQYANKNGYNKNAFNNEKKEDPYKETKNVIQKIKNNGSLSSILTIDEINLPNKASFNIAKELKKDLNTNQLRKIFSQIKECENIKNDIKEAKNQLFNVLPLIAYAVGRGNCPKIFFELLNECINDNKLIEMKDVETLINFLTSIVAYNKYFEA